MRESPVANEKMIAAWASRRGRAGSWTAGPSGRPSPGVIAPAQEKRAASVAQSV